MDYTFPTPTDENAFESFCMRLLRVHWPSSDPQLYGRRRQRQDGVDITDESGAEPLRAAQCKYRKPGLPIASRRRRDTERRTGRKMDGRKMGRLPRFWKNIFLPSIFLPACSPWGRGEGKTGIQNVPASIATDGDFQGAIAGRFASADFGYSTKDRGVEVARSALGADADRHVLQDHETAFVAQRLPLDASFFDLSTTVFAVEIVHGFGYLISYTVMTNN